MKRRTSGKAARVFWVRAIEGSRDGRRGGARRLNALLNYLYALLEAESRIALAIVGLDPGIGILHTDQRARDSLALDLMETARPAVDRYVLDLLAARPLRGSDFAETSKGQCRIMPTLARQLATTTPAWAGEVAPHAELVAKLLAADAGLATPPTILTGNTRRVARPSGSRIRPDQVPRPTVPAQACRDCGADVPAGRRRCANCHATANAARLRAHQALGILARQATGNHPSTRADVRASIAAAQRVQWQARHQDTGTGYTGHPSEFRRLILPRLAGARPGDLARATGLSRGYCAQIRDGRRVPHVRHWAAFQLAGLNGRRAEPFQRTHIWSIMGEFPGAGAV